MATPVTTDSSRKRLRSESRASSTSEASSPKRAASVSPATPGNAKSPLTTSPSLSVQEKDVDEVMQSQSAALSLSDDPSAAGPSTDTTISAKQKLDEIERLKSRPMALGDTWYIVSRSWYRNWASACGGAPVKGAPENESQISGVDNSAIAGAGSNKLNGDPLQEGINIELVPQEAWDLLVKWYGQPSHTFGRKVIAEGVNSTLRIEFYPLTCTLYVCRLDNPPPPQHIEFTKAFTLFDLSKTFIQPRVRELSGPVFRSWKVDSTGIPDDDDDEILGYTPQRVMDHKASYFLGLVNRGFDPKQVTVEEALISSGDRIIIEVKENGDYHVDGVPDYPAWYQSYKPTLPPPAPSQPATSAASGALFGNGPDFFTKLGGSTLGPVPIVPGNTRTMDKASGSSSSAVVPFAGRSRPQQPERVRGTTGLNNLGNTCYMNSALQCLAHLPELTEYFLSGAFQRELNGDNPLSTGGELAKSYGGLLQSLFNDGSYSVAPRDFKMKIARHNPTFSGYMQHDTQELLAFLLDGLHEDLNRILKKPYVENPTWENGAELELCKLARDFWTGYKKRNDSVIVDLFQGQYKSTLVCPDCQKVSVTFDPFMYLTLPLPVHKTWEHEVYFVTWDNSRPNYKTRVMLPSTSTFRDIKVLLGKWFQAKPDNMLAADIFQSKIYRLFPDYHAVSEVLDNDVLFFYELPIASGQSSPSYKPSPTDPFVVPVYTISHQTNDTYRRFTNAKWNSKEVWGFPFFIAVDPMDPYSEEAIYALLVERYEQVTSIPNDLYKWEEPDVDGVMVSAPASQGSEPDGELIDQPMEEEVPETDEIPTKADDPFDDLEEVTLPAYADVVEQDTHSTPRSLIKVAPKPELFTWSVMENNFELAPRHNSGAAYDVGRPANLAARLMESENAMDESSTQDAAPRPSGFLRPKDGLVCEWDINIRQLYFGDKGMGPESRWNATEDYVDEEQQALRVAQYSRLRAGITIDDCLNEFVKEEKLGEADPWYCPRCKKHQQATKKFDLWKVPDILVVHLKRFSNSRVLRDKIDVPVDFPIEGLDLESRIGERAAAKVLLAQGVDVAELGIQDVHEPLVYDLFGVDEHMGGLGGGHYRAYAKNAEDGKWYHFDDSRVDVSDARDVVTNSAYLLFYRRRTETPVGGQTTTKIEEARALEGMPQPPETKEPELATGVITSDNLFASGSGSSPPWAEFDDRANDPFPSSISQLGSPRSIPTPTTPERDIEYNQTGTPILAAYTRKKYMRSASQGGYPSDVEDDAGEQWRNRLGDRASTHAQEFSGILQDGDGIPMLSSDDELMISSGRDYRLRSVTNNRGVDEDYDDGASMVDEILVEEPLDTVIDKDSGPVYGPSLPP
ncbi:CSN-associated deubiquitinating enzyme Ubp12 [Tulasnella sp. JGI-2019a]|nr:CSN-associated deubiquitinating enzyme Ubp12 [Tulasnella sp. JGI-2019a]